MVGAVQDDRIGQDHRHVCGHAGRDRDALAPQFPPDQGDRGPVACAREHQDQQHAQPPGGGARDAAQQDQHQHHRHDDPDAPQEDVEPVGPEHRPGEGHAAAISPGHEEERPVLAIQQPVAQHHERHARQRDQAPPRGIAEDRGERAFMHQDHDGRGHGADGQHARNRCQCHQQDSRRPQGACQGGRQRRLPQHGRLPEHQVSERPAHDARLHDGRPPAVGPVFGLLLLRLGASGMIGHAQDHQRAAHGHDAGRQRPRQEQQPDLPLRNERKERAACHDSDAQPFQRALFAPHWSAARREGKAEGDERGRTRDRQAAPQKRDRQRHEQQGHDRKSRPQFRRQKPRNGRGERFTDLAPVIGADAGHAHERGHGQRIGAGMVHRGGCAVPQSGPYLRDPGRRDRQEQEGGIKGWIPDDERARGIVAQGRA
ncbi:conserved hypothetical protein [Gluconacetobacter diazotrophicus PA1 5]|uniref:Uncharacterized protein n=1 Tax=Gluconacetobacter diazotrophicus (strain ATCC 49037 / DSM 5601 / CCUG 37298 / CIP 103539 / LMG 7603 / PAl5) TaxID=272568 RepID=A9HSE4_GLUDA|nr:conserved hypothetical protein [Gluconacetobacter diazotrophicus PA1 5]